MRRNPALPRLLILLAALLFACQSATQPAQPVTTRRATFTPLDVKTAMPPPTPSSSPKPATLTLPDQEGTSAAATTGTEAVNKALHFILVQHTRCAWEPSWCPIEQGILDAARELDVTVTLLGPGMPEDAQPSGENPAGEGNLPLGGDETLNLQQTAALIDRAVAARPDGIAVTISDPVVLSEPILRAIASGIPVIAYHDGAGPIQDDLPYLTYLGMDNYQGGYRGAQRLIQAGARAGVCINPSPTLAALQTRCKGFQTAFNEAGLKSDVLNTSGDAAQALHELQDYAQTHAEVNAFLTTEAASARTFYAYAQTSSRPAGVFLHGAFDPDAEIHAYIDSGVTLFGIGQQPYLQGYEAVFWLTMIGRFGFKPATPVTATGPSFVDKTSLHSQPDPERPLKLIFVQHALCTWDSYWCVVERGIQEAARERGVQVDIWGPETFDLSQMAELIDAAAAAHPDGIAVTVPDPAILREPIRRVIQAGYPVVAYDTAAGPLKDDIPYLTFIGADVYAEYRGGYLAALRLIRAGGRAGVCVNHQAGHVALDARCRGMMDAFTVEGLQAEVLDCGGDPEQAFTTLQEYARSHDQVNAYLTMGPGEPGAGTVYRYLEASGRPRGEVLHGTFDLSQAVVLAIEDGTSLFAVDGQPYLQGYSAVMFLTLALRQNIWPAEPITPTGPGFVDLSNIAIVKQLAGIYR